MRGVHSVPIGLLVGAALGAAIGFAVSHYTIDETPPLGPLKAPVYMAMSAGIMGLAGWLWYGCLSPEELAARERAPLDAALDRATRAEAEVERLRSELARIEE